MVVVKVAINYFTSCFFNLKAKPDDNANFKLVSLIVGTVQLNFNAEALAMICCCSAYFHFDSFDLAR